MARLHARKRGKSGSKKPDRIVAPSWIIQSKEEIEEIIVKLAKEGNTSSAIGMTLRDQYGVPDVRSITGKSITKVLKENNLQDEVPEDIQNLIKTAIRLRKHLDMNKRDIHNTRALTLIESKIHRLTKYYKREGVLDANWVYEPGKAKLLV